MEEISRKDLAQYKEVHGNGHDWSVLARIYLLAYALWLTIGNPHNQVCDSSPFNLYFARVKGRLVFFMIGIIFVLNVVGSFGNICR
jgi:hypothetical protein